MRIRLTDPTYDMPLETSTTENSTGLHRAELTDTWIFARQIRVLTVSLLLVLEVFAQSSLGQDRVVTPTELWKFKTGAGIVSSPRLDHGMLYVGSSDSSLYALEAGTGDQVWRFETEGAVNSGVAVSGGLVYFGATDGHYYAVDKESGRMVWRFETGGESEYDAWDHYLSTPVVQGGRVYFGSGDHRIYALDAETGVPIWSHETDGIVHSTGALGDSTIYFGSFDGHMYALNLSDGHLRWKFNTVGEVYFPKGEVQGSALLHDGVLYFGSRDYNVYALKANDGTGHWVRNTPSWVIARPHIDGDLLFYGNSEAPKLFARSITTREIVWEYPVNLNVMGSAVSYGDFVVFPCYNGKMYGMRARTGELAFTIQTEASQEHWDEIFDAEGEIRKEHLEGLKTFNDVIALYERFHDLGSILSTPVVEGDVLYFTSVDGYVYAYSLASQ